MCVPHKKIQKMCHVAVEEILLAYTTRLNNSKVVLETLWLCDSAAVNVCVCVCKHTFYTVLAQILSYKYITKVSTPFTCGVQRVWWHPGKHQNSCPLLKSSMVVVASWSRAALMPLALRSCSSERETWIPSTVWSPLLDTGLLDGMAVLQHVYDPKHTFKMTTAVVV